MEEQILGIGSDVLATIGIFTGSAELEAASALASAIQGCFEMFSNDSDLSQVPVDSASNANVPTEAATGFENVEVSDPQMDQPYSSQMDFSQDFGHHVHPTSEPYHYLDSGLL